MNKQSIKLICGICFVAILCSFSAFGRDHRTLNGTWKLVPVKSDFAGQAVIQTGTITIDAQGDIVDVTRNFAYESATEAFFYKDMTGSENNMTTHSGKDLKSKTHWDHDVLKVTTTRSGAATVESYSLAPDNTLRVSVISPGGKTITLFFERQ
jgi:hypothetical protein